MFICDSYASCINAFKYIYASRLIEKILKSHVGIEINLENLIPK